MLIYDETTGEYFDTEKVEAIIAAFLLAYAPDDWEERLGQNEDRHRPIC